MTEFADKVRSIGTGFNRGAKKTTRVVDERDGSTAGVHVEHWSGRVDAVAQPKTERFTLPLARRSE